MSVRFKPDEQPDRVEILVDGEHRGWIVRRVQPIATTRSYATSYRRYFVARLSGGRTIGGHHRTLADAKRAVKQEVAA